MSLFHKMEKLASVVSIEKRDQIQAVLSENEIQYEIKVKDNGNIHALNSGYTLKNTGRMNIKMTYTFYVEKEDAERALSLLKSL